MNKQVREDMYLAFAQVLWGECIAGAMYVEDFMRQARAAGFLDPRKLPPVTPVEVENPALRQIIGNARFFSITFRLFKLPGMIETTCEDYGQVAIYKV